MVYVVLSAERFLVVTLPQDTACTVVKELSESACTSLFYIIEV